MKNARNITSIKKQVNQNSPTVKPLLRYSRGNISTISINHKLANINESVIFRDNTPKNKISIGRSVSTSALHNIKLRGAGFQGKSKSIDVLHLDEKSNTIGVAKKAVSVVDSKLSIWCVESDYNSTSSYQHFTASVKSCSAKIQNCKAKLVAKSKEPCKARAIVIVMLTSGSFILTWMPFFIVLNLYVFCEDKLENPRCIYLRSKIVGPLAILAYANSILNPLIYAWWHRGFKNAVKTQVRRFYSKKKSFPNFLAKGIC